MVRCFAAPACRTTTVPSAKSLPATRALVPPAQHPRPVVPLHRSTQRRRYDEFISRRAPLGLPAIAGTGGATAEELTNQLREQGEMIRRMQGVIEEDKEADKDKLPQYMLSYQRARQAVRRCKSLYEALFR